MSRDEVLNLESGLHALDASPEFRGPVESLDGHESNDHLALLYESQEELFAAAVPFVRQGLRRGERCLYIADENSKDEVIAAMRAGGIDVDTALESGALSLHTKQDTYLRNGEFDPEEMIEFLAASVEASIDEYEGLRIAGEMTWIFGEDPQMEALIEYEGLINELLPEVDSIALCQYNRERFPAEIIRDVIRTHPHLVYDNTVCQNFYYTPPEEFFGPEQPASEVDRMMRTLQDRTRAKTELRDRERFLHEQTEITTDPNRSFEEKLQALFELGCDRFDLELGAMARVDTDDDWFEVEYVSDDHAHFEPGVELPLSETYCTAATEIRAAAGVTNPDEDGYDDVHVYQEFGIEAYLGTYVGIEGGTDRTFFFVSADRRETEFSDAERTFLQLMGQWVQSELGRRQRERELRERKEYLSALVETTPECIKTVAADGTLLQMNPAGLDMVEADSDSDVIGECVYDLIASEHRQRFREFNERICRGESETLEFDIIGLDGTRRHMESHAAPLRHSDGTISHVALTRDVTEQVERESELRQTKNRFETVFEQSDDGIYILDPHEDEFVDANPAACKMTGYSRDELSSMGPSDLHPDELDQLSSFLDEVREQGTAWTEDLHCRTKDGRDVPAEVAASSITLDGRDLVLANVRHIEERKKHEQYQRELYETVADPQTKFEEKLERLLELGRERFGLEMAGLNHLPSWDGAFRLEAGVGLGVEAEDERLWTDPGEGCFCRQAITADAPVDMTDVRDTDWADDRIHEEFGLTSYLGTKVTSGSTPYGTLWFGSTEPRERSFTDAERTFIELMGQWVGYEIEQRDQKRFQRELYEITADTDLSTDEKIERLLELGCERLDLPVGLLNRDNGTALEVEQMHGTHPDLDEGEVTPPQSEHYCREVVETGGPVNVADAEAAGWDGDPLYDEIGLETYAGMQVTVGGGVYGTLCFADTSPRQAEFSEAERAFLDLMSQCVGYELERSRREDLQHALSVLGRELLDAETTTEVTERFVAISEETFNHSVTAIALYDDERGELRPAAYTDAAELVEEISLLDGSDGVGWDAFIEGETKRMNDPFAAVDATTHPPVSEAIVHPLGTHGVFLVGSTAPDGFRRGDVEDIETAAANVQAALDRTIRERQLQERERTLEEQNESLERLNRINDIIRSIDQALVQASNRSEIENVVCEQLATVGPYELAWIGEHDTLAQEVTPKEWAGTETCYLDGLSVSTDDGSEAVGPICRAVTTGEPQVVNDILGDTQYEPKRQEALNRGYHATVAIPLTYEDSLYGVLNVYAGQPSAFDELEKSVLTELADNIAYAINAVERKKALASNTVTELEFSITDTNFEVVDLVQETGCEFSIESLIPRTDGTQQTFFTTRGAPAEEILEFRTRLPVTDIELVSEQSADDGPICLFEATLSDESLSEVVLEHGGRVQQIEAADGSATITIHLAAEADVREFTDMFTTRYRDSELVAQRTREQSAPTFTEFYSVLTDELTDRQLEVLQMAYFSGYFEQPRQRSSKEVASALDISQPTFSSHLRSAQRKLYCQFFEEQSLHD